MLNSNYIFNTIKFSLFFLLFLFSTKVFSIEKKIIISSTTSTHDSGLLTYLNNEFKKKYNINVQVLAQGTGQALRTAKDGNVELVMVHHEVSELEFMKNGFGVERFSLMYNDFIIVGPKSDLNKCKNIQSKLSFINSNNLNFISRGDDSGTHKKELELWRTIEIKKGYFHSNYLQVGQGMGNTLLIANEKKGYTLSDRGTWISFNRKNNLKIICQFQPPLINQYGIIIVNPNINKNLDYESAKLYVNWLISSEGKELINNYKKEGQQLFFFNYY